MKSSTMLRKARAILVANEWGQGVLARNKYRHEVDPTSKSAVKFCATGALYAAAGIKVNDPYYCEFELAYDYLLDAIRDKGYWSVETFNDMDGTKKKDVLKAYSRAIKFAKKGESL